MGKVEIWRNVWLKRLLSAFHPVKVSLSRLVVRSNSRCDCVKKNYSVAIFWKLAGFRLYTIRVEPDLWCFHRNWGYCWRCWCYDQTVIPSHLPTCCRTLPSRLQIWHTRRQAATTVKAMFSTQWRYFPAVLTELYSFSFLFLMHIFVGFLLSLLRLQAFVKALTGIKWTHSSA